MQHLEPMETSSTQRWHQFRHRLRPVVTLVISAGLIAGLCSPRPGWTSQIDVVIAGQPSPLVGVDGAGKTGNHGPGATAQGVAKTRRSGPVAVQLLTSDTADDSTLINEFPIASPDGRYLLFQRSEDPKVRKWPDGSTSSDFDETSNWDIYRMNVDGSNRIRLTDHPSSEDQPIWSPDQKSIVYRFLNGKSFDIFLMDADGTNKRPLVDSPDSDEKTPAFSPDGRKVVFFSNRDGLKWNLYTIDLATRKIDRLTRDKAEDKHPQYTPDGTELIFHSSRASFPITVRGETFPLMNIYSLDLATGAIRPLTLPNKRDDNRHPFISPNGRFVAYHTNTFEPDSDGVTRRAGRNLYIVTRDGARRINVTLNDKRAFKHPSWSADGNGIFCVVKPHKGRAWAIGYIDVREELKELERIRDGGNQGGPARSRN